MCMWILGLKGLQNFSDSDPPPGGEYVQQHRSETKEKHLYAEVMCCAPTTIFWIWFFLHTSIAMFHSLFLKNKCSKIDYRCEQDSNLRGRTPLDFKSNALTTRSSQHLYVPNVHSLKKSPFEKEFTKELNANRAFVAILSENQRRKINVKGGWEFIYSL